MLHIYKECFKGSLPNFRREGVGRIKRMKNCRETNDSKRNFNPLRAWCFEVFFRRCGRGFCILNL